MCWRQDPARDDHVDILADWRLINVAECNIGAPGSLEYWRFWARNCIAGNEPVHRVHPHREPRPAGLLLPLRQTQYRRLGYIEPTDPTRLLVTPPLE